MKDGEVKNVIDGRGVTTYKQIGNTTVVSRRSTGIGGAGLFRIVLILLLLFNVMRVIVNPSNVMTFTGFLEMLRNAPTIEVGWLKQFNMWGTSLTSIPLIGDGLAFLTNIVSVALFGATGVIQIGLYAVYFMRYLFI